MDRTPDFDILSCPSYVLAPVVQWTELRTSKPNMGVRFPPGARVDVPERKRVYGGHGETVITAGCGPAIEGSIPSGHPMKIPRDEGFLNDHGRVKNMIYSCI